MDGFVSLLHKGFARELGEKGLAYLARIQHGITKMSDMINAFLLLAKSTQFPDKTDNIDLSEMVRDHLEQCQSAHSPRRITAIIQQNVMVTANPALLDIAIGNLISNACKFTKDRSEAKIEFGMVVRDNVLTYYVRDNGIGFDMSKAGKLFMPLQRLHCETQFGGTGLGLAIVQRVIHRHGGSVWAEAAPNQGCTIFFTLNAKAAIQSVG
jgi:light-regulated signal transduction histidine kinase (bacteriophytochrome)